MIKLSSLVLSFFIMCSFSFAQIPEGFSFVKQSGGIEEYKLDSNGLSILLMEDHSAPVVTFMVTFHVGSRNEVTGTTGATHILEHLLFKGTEKYNKAKGNERSILLENIGARINATTWTDRTNYFESIPSNYLELAVDFESDRMRNLLLLEKDRDAEMTVVRNEYERGENNPYYALDKEIFATAFQAHPYHHSTIGWRSDIEGVSIAKLREFYDTFYWPDNATVTIIGDFEKTNALSLIKKYYGVIPRSKNEIPQLYTVEPKQEGPRRLILKRPGQTSVVGIAWKTPQALHKDSYVLQVLDNILANGKSSRFYNALIDKNKSIRAWNDHSLFHDPSLFISYSYLAPGATHKETEQIILAEIEKIKNEGVTADEVKRALNQISAETIYDRDGSYSIASQINEAIAMGDWTYFTTFLENIRKVTAAEIKEVANKYFIEESSTTGYFIPLQPASGKEKSGPSSWTTDHAKYYFRTPETGLEANTGSSSIEQSAPGKSAIAENISRVKINGIDLITAKTGVKEMVTFNGSMAAGDIFSPADKPMLADLTGNMIDKGTTKNDKFALAEKLENIGSNISVSVDKNNVTFSGRCLKKDVSTVVGLLAEQLRYPAFSKEELEKLKKQREGSLKRLLDDTNFRASEELNRLIFNENHPNYDIPVQKLLESLKNVSIEDVRDFYNNYYGPKSMIFVFAGDIDNKDISSAFTKSFKGWTGGVSFKTYEPQLKKVQKGKHAVTVEGKTSVSVIMGQSTGLKRSDKDYMAFSIANTVFGSGFAGRLMSIIRDDEGLTYGIGSAHNNDIYYDGRWFIRATFAPALLAKGLSSTNRELKRLVDEGITKDEFDKAITNMVGSYKVNLSTTRGMATQILSFIQRGFDVSYMDEYPKLIQTLSVQDVNSAIKKYIDLESVVTVMAGSIDKDGNALDKK